MVTDQRASSGLLHWFIAEHLRAYREPSREGTPRGEPVGFGRSKFHAALLTLTNTPLEEAARRAGVAYDVLRKWRAEPVFKAKVAELAREFTGYVREVARRGAVRAEAYRARGKSVEWIIYRGPDEQPLFGDAGSYYGPPVVDALAEAVTRSEPLASRLSAAEQNSWFEFQRLIYGEIFFAVFGSDVRAAWKDRARWAIQHGLAVEVLRFLTDPRYDEWARMSAIRAAKLLVTALKHDVEEERPDVALAAQNGHVTVVAPETLQTQKSSV
jgi:hypothetical protein